LSRDTQRNWNILGGHIQQTHVSLQRWLEAQHLTLNNPNAIAKLIKELSIQSNFVAYLHTFRIGGMLLCISIAMIFFIKIKNNGNQKLVPVEAH